MAWIGVGAILAGGWIITQSCRGSRLGPALVTAGVVLIVVAIAK